MVTLGACSGGLPVLPLSARTKTISGKMPMTEQKEIFRKDIFIMIAPKSPISGTQISHNSEKLQFLHTLSGGSLTRLGPFFLLGTPLGRYAVEMREILAPIPQSDESFTSNSR
jgi:hypothetical protein